MTQIDPRNTTTTTPSTPDRPLPGKGGSSYNWRVSVGMALGLALLFGVLFGLRALGIFPPRPAEDPEIAAARATLASLPTQQPAAIVQPTLAPTQPAAQATRGITVPTAAPTSAVAQRKSTPIAESAQTGTVFVTTATTDGTATSSQSLPAAAPTSVSGNSSPAQGANRVETSAPALPQATPVAVNLPADLASAILQGYTNYWTVRVNAMRDPTDPSIDLGSVMAGSELIGAQKTIAQYRDAGEAFASDVKHTIWITSASSDNAVIVDQFTSTTLRVDPDTKAPLDGTPSIENRTDTFEMQHVDGAWKVVDEP
jgi:hypothetical protein